MWTFESNSYEGRYLQLSITENVDAITNSSTLYWTLTVTGGESACYTVGATTISIDDVAVYSRPKTSWDERIFPATRGTLSGSLNVPHDSDGRRTIYIGFSTRVYYFEPQDFGGYITLTPIDRTVPTVSISASSITANSFYLSGSASAYCDVWLYSLNNGATWYTLANTGYSGGTTISGLSAYTDYTVRICARKSSNYLYGYSSYLSLRTLGGATISSVDTVTADAATVTLRMSVTVHEASYTNKLEIKNGNTTYLTISNLLWSAGTATRTITLTSAQRAILLASMANMKSFTATFAITSYDGSAQIGNGSSATATIQTTAANSAPTMGDFAFEDSYSATVAVTGNNQVFIQGQSTLKVTPTAATARNGASITNYTATCNGLSASSASGSAITVGKVNKSGTVSVVLTATDSRGYTVSVTKNITVIPYSKPSLSEVSIRRTNDIESEMRLIFSGFLSAISVDGVQKNSLMYVRYRYKLTSASSYGSYVNILPAVTASGTSFSYSNPELCDLDANSSYDFHLQIRDKLNSLTSLDLYFVIPQGTPLLALRKGLVGINMPNPDAALHVVGNTHLEGAATIQGNARIVGTLTPDVIDYPFEKPCYGICSTAADVEEKAVVCPDFGTLKKGALVAVQFSDTNTVGSASLNVNGTGARPICGLYGYYLGANMWSANQIVLFSYNGNWWMALNCVPAATDRYGPTKLTNSVSLSDSNLAASAYAVKQAYDRSSWSSISLSSPLALAYGGTGASSAVNARSNLGLYCTTLYSGSLSSGSIAFDFGSYKAYIIVGMPSASSSRMSIVIPQWAISTYEINWQIADESYYRSFRLYYYSSYVYLTIAGGSGYITEVYGVN